MGCNDVGAQSEMLNDPDTVTRCRSRAAQLRLFAKPIKDPKLRADVEIWAKEYDQMAVLAEQMGRPW
jgi:hypothetical protein